MLRAWDKGWKPLSPKPYRIIKAAAQNTWLALFGSKKKFFFFYLRGLEKKIFLLRTLKVNGSLVCMFSGLGGKRSNQVESMWSQSASSERFFSTY